MKVILKEHVKSLGNVGDMVNVSSGYARNFLIPGKLAILADEQNKKFIEDQKRRLAKKVNAQKEQAMLLKKKIDGIVIELTKRVGGNGKLFGAVTNTELVHELKNREVEIERRWLVVDNPIKETGNFDIKVKIFADVEASFQVKVAMDPSQIEEMKKRSEQKKQAQKEKEEEDKKTAEYSKEAHEKDESSSDTEDAASTATISAASSDAAEKSAKGAKASKKKEGKEGKGSKGSKE